MAMSIQMRQRIETNQRSAYVRAFHKLQQDLENVQIGSADMIALLNQAKHDHDAAQSSEKFRNRFNHLTERIENADNRDTVRHIFQWSN